jgi:uncharacterized protein
VNRKPANDEQLSKLSSLLSNEFLGLMILPTEACNFRCKYCYERHPPGRMSDRTVAALKSFLEQRLPSLQSVNVSWFGGEPLIAKDIVVDVCRFIQHRIEGRKDITFASSATTNGYLLDAPTLKALVEAGVTEYQISLDGPPEIHNQTRVRADGAGTFERIWTNLIAIRNSNLPVKVMLRIHLTQESRFGMEPLLALLRAQILHDHRFTVFFRVVSKLGGENDHLLNAIPEDDEAAVVAELEHALGGERFKHKSDFPMCYAAHANQFVIRANGDIAKCTVALYDERNKIGSLRADGTLEIVSSRLTPWIRGIATLDADQLACPWRDFPVNNLTSADRA